MRLVPILAALFLAGCLDLPADHTKERLNAGLQGMMGKEIGATIQALGYPTTQRVIAGNVVWSSRGTLTFLC